MTGRYTVLLTPPAKRALTETLPPSVAAAAWELISGALAVDPWRMGKPLHGPYEGLHTARRGTYRILYKIDEGKSAIEIRSIRHRADAYRT
ncbi:MAG: type II toxin-antitoxin system RelE family toxin [Trebonia sp.]